MSLTRDELTNLFNGITSLTKTSTLTLDDISHIRMILSAMGAEAIGAPTLDMLESMLRDGADINNDKHMTLDEFIAYAEQHQV